MINFSKEKMEAPVKDLLKFDKKGKKSDLPVVMKDEPLESVIDIALKYPRRKAVYVVNENKELIGLITITGLMRNLFSYDHKPQAHSRRILEMITADVASEIMHKEIYFKNLNSTIGNVLFYMIKGGIYAIPIVDEKNRILHEVSLRDILRFLHKS
ncbi:MAG: CBS domain-containing protein [Leptospirales bacterium]